jgi:hypothetical protein
MATQGACHARFRRAIERGCCSRTSPAARQGCAVGPFHSAFRVAPNEPEDAAEHVRSHGIEVFGPQQFGDVAGAYFTLVEFFAHAHASNATSRAE